MIEKILRFSIAHRLLILMLTISVAAYGVYALGKLPIDAVPDITNNQVQINVEVPALSPFEVEKQVTYSIETAMAGIPGLIETRSMSRNGFAQVTVIFEDNVDIYFARAQVNERLVAIAAKLVVSVRALGAQLDPLDLRPAIRKRVKQRRRKQQLGLVARLMLNLLGQCGAALLIARPGQLDLGVQGRQQIELPHIPDIQRPPGCQCRDRSIDHPQQIVQVREVLHDRVDHHQVEARRRDGAEVVGSCLL